MPNLPPDVDIRGIVKKAHEANAKTVVSPPATTPAVTTTAPTSVATPPSPDRSLFGHVVRDIWHGELNWSSWSAAAKQNRAIKTGGPPAVATSAATAGDPTVTPASTDPAASTADGSEDGKESTPTPADAEKQKKVAAKKARRARVRHAIKRFLQAALILIIAFYLIREQLLYTIPAMFGTSWLVVVGLLAELASIVTAVLALLSGLAYRRETPANDTPAEIKRVKASRNKKLRWTIIYLAAALGLAFGAHAAFQDAKTHAAYVHTIHTVQPPSKVQIKQVCSGGNVLACGNTINFALKDMGNTAQALRAKGDTADADILYKDQQRLYPLCQNLEKVAPDLRCNGPMH